MKKLNIIVGLSFLLLIGLVSATQLDPTKWIIKNDTTGAPSILTDIYELNSSIQSYVIAQTFSGSDKGTVLTMTKLFNTGETVDLDITYNSGSGNQEGKPYFNGIPLDLIMAYAGYNCGGCATSGDIGYWNGPSEVSNTLGLHHLWVEFNGPSNTKITFTRPDMTNFTYTATTITYPIEFGVGLRTGGDGIASYSFDNFRVNEILYDDFTSLQPICNPQLITPLGLAWDGTDFYYANEAAKRVYKVSTNSSILGSFTGPGGEKIHGIAWDGTYLWLVSYPSGNLNQIDANQAIIDGNTNNAIISTISSISSYTEAMAYGDNSLWISFANINQIKQIEPTTGGVISSFEDDPLASSRRPMGCTWKNNKLACSFGTSSTTIDEINTSQAIIDGNTYSSVIKSHAIDPTGRVAGVAWDGNAMWYSNLTDGCIYYFIDLPPTIDSFSPLNLEQTINEGDSLQFTQTSSDLNGNSLTYSWFLDNTQSATTQNYTYVTDYTSSGNHTIKIIISDGSLQSEKVWNVTVMEISDSDNDGINDSVDNVIGNVSDIITNIPDSNLTINGTTNLSQVFNGTLQVEFKQAMKTVAKFDFNFSSDILNLTGLKIEKQLAESTKGYILINGLALSNNQTKTLYLDHFDYHVSTVCIKDLDIDDISNVSNNCQGAGEYLIPCNGILKYGYKCSPTYDEITGDEGYEIIGLRHSGIREQCGDNDEDGYGELCNKGPDCNDNDPTKHYVCNILTPTLGVNYFGNSNENSSIDNIDVLIAKDMASLKSTECGVIPNDCKSLDMNGDGIVTIIDVSMLRDLSQNKNINITGKPTKIINLNDSAQKSTGYSTVAVGVTAANNMPRQGIGVLFTIDPSSTAIATLGGRDPSNGNNYISNSNSVFELTNKMSQGGNATIWVNPVSTGILIINTFVPGDSKKQVNNLTGNIIINII